MVVVKHGQGGEPLVGEAVEAVVLQGELSVAAFDAGGGPDEGFEAGREGGLDGTADGRVEPRERAGRGAGGGQSALADRANGAAFGGGPGSLRDVLEVACWCQGGVDRLAVPLPLALEIAADHGLYAYDAYLITCALQQRVPLLTLDRALALAAGDVGVSLKEVGE